MAGLIRSPSRFSPLKNPDGAKRERDNVLDRMLTLFPFEAPLYREANIRVDYIGHPMAHDAATPESRRSLAVPPVEISSMANSFCRARANSTMPVLSDTESSARRIGTRSGGGDDVAEFMRLLRGRIIEESRQNITKRMGWAA